MKKKIKRKKRFVFIIVFLHVFIVGFSFFEWALRHLPSNGFSIVLYMSDSTAYPLQSNARHGQEKIDQTKFGSVM